jgi:hypothetical protein
MQIVIEEKRERRSVTKELLIIIYMRVLSVGANN